MNPPKQPTSLVRLQITKATDGTIRLRANPACPEALRGLLDAEGTLSFDDHDRARDQMIAAAGVSHVVGVPAAVRAMFAAPPPAPAQQLDEIPSELWGKLFKYQRDGVMSVLAKNRRALIAVT